MKIFTVDERIAETKLKLLIYGEPGVGKTWLACSLAKAVKAIMLCTEPAISDATIRAAQNAFGVAPDITEIASVKELSEAYDFLISSKHEYEAVIIDSFTDTYRRIMEATLKGTEQAKMKRYVQELDVPEQSDWYRVQERQREVIRKFRDLPMHVVMTALVMDARGEAMRVPYVQPKNFAIELPAYFNYVGLLTTTNVDDKTGRKLILGRKEWCLTKNSAELFNDEVHDPDLATMVSVLQNQ